MATRRWCNIADNAANLAANPVDCAYFKKRAASALSALNYYQIMKYSKY
jgi:hypothetical protein